MWITIIIIAFTFILVKFLYDNNRQSAKVKKEGGMRLKYSTLIHHLLNSDPRAQIFYETSDSITVGVSSAGGVTLFIVTQTFGKVTIQWKFESPFFGKHKMEWQFPEFEDQDNMAQKIADTCGKY